MILLKLATLNKAKLLKHKYKSKLSIYLELINYFSIKVMF